MDKLEKEGEGMKTEGKFIGMLVAVSVVFFFFLAVSCGDDDKPPPTPLTNCQKLCNKVGGCYGDEAKSECRQECTNDGFTDNQLGCTTACFQDTCSVDESQVEDCILACFELPPPTEGVTTVKEILDGDPAAGEVTLVGITYEEIDPDDEYMFTDGTGVIRLDFDGTAPPMQTPIRVTGTIASSEIDVPVGGWEAL